MLEDQGRGGRMIFRRRLTTYYNVVIGSWPHKIEIVGGKNFGRSRLKYNKLKYHWVYGWKRQCTVYEIYNNIYAVLN